MVHNGAYLGTTHIIFQPPLCSWRAEKAYSIPFAPTAL